MDLASHSLCSRLSSVSVYLFQCFSLSLSLLFIPQQTGMIAFFIYRQKKDIVKVHKATE